MNFANPVFLLGMLGMLVPLIIHLWRRRRAKTIRFGAIRFLLQSERATRRRRKFWEYLLLMVRMLSIGVLSMALAGPFKMESIPSLSLGAEQSSLVMILDDSMSMSREKLSRTLFERARQSALGALNQLPDYDYVGLVLAASGEEVPLTKNHGQIRQMLEKASAGWQKARMIQSISRAEQMLSRAESPGKKVVVFTDLQRASFEEGMSLSDFDGEIYIYDVSGDRLEPNYTLSPVELSRISGTAGESVKVSAIIYNFSDRDVEARINLSLGRDTLTRGSVQVKPWASSEKSFLVSLGENISAEGKLLIENPDSLEMDNLSYFHLRGGGRVKALILDGNFSREPLNRDSYFLERALNPRLYALSRIDPEVMSESGFAQADLRNYQVIILANCRILDKAEADRIKNFVSAGGGLLIALGNNTDAERYNQLLGDLLPREIRELKVSFAGAEANAELKPLHLDTSFIGDPDRHPILSPFASAKGADPSVANFYKHFLLFQELIPRSKVILQLTDGSPILLEKNFGAGIVMMFSSTINQDWNDLCIYPSFLPIFYQATLYLARSLFDIGAQGAQVGEQIELALPAEKNSVLVRTSRGAEMRLSADREAEQGKIRLAKLTEPGIYYFWYLPGPEPRTELNADFILAVHSDPLESDFRKISLSDLKKMLPANKLYLQSEDRVKSPEELETKTSLVKKTYHHNFLLALIILLAMEIIILTRSGLE